MTSNIKLVKTFIILFTLTCVTTNYSQETIIDSIPDKTEASKRKWFDSFSIRGYVQVRYNGLLETNPNLGCDQCDKSWGEDGGFFFKTSPRCFFWSGV